MFIRVHFTLKMLLTRAIDMKILKESTTKINSLLLIMLLFLLLLLLMSLIRVLALSLFSTCEYYSNILFVLLPLQQMKKSAAERTQNNDNINY